MIIVKVHTTDGKALPGGPGFSPGGKPAFHPAKLLSAGKGIRWTKYPPRGNAKCAPVIYGRASATEADMYAHARVHMST